MGNLEVVTKLLVKTCPHFQVGVLLKTVPEVTVIKAFFEHSCQSTKKPQKKQVNVAGIT